VTFTIAAKNVAQAITGNFFSSGSITVLVPQNPGQTPYTVPAGKRAQVHVSILIQELTAVQNMRFRVAGILVYQEGLGIVITQATGPKYIDLGIFNIDQNLSVTVTTTNDASEGGTMILNVAVLAEVPR